MALVPYICKWLDENDYRDIADELRASSECSKTPRGSLEAIFGDSKMLADMKREIEEEEIKLKAFLESDEDLTQSEGPNEEEGSALNQPEGEKKEVFSVNDSITVIQPESQDSQLPLGERAWLPVGERPWMPVDPLPVRPAHVYAAPQVGGWESVRNEGRPRKFLHEPSYLDKPLPVVAYDSKYVGPGGERWDIIYEDEDARSWSSYLANPFDKETLNRWFQTTVDKTSWNQPRVKGGLLPRKAAWFIAPGCSCKYHYSGTVWEPTTFPDWFQEITDAVMEKVGLSAKLKTTPNSCNVNLYQGGMGSVGWHSDNEPLFESKYRDCLIISLSLGTTRKFQMKKLKDRNVFIEVYLNDGDLVTMEGLFQKHFLHRVPKERYIFGDRINFTWRWLTKHNSEECQLETKWSPGWFFGRKRKNTEVQQRGRKRRKLQNFYSTLAGNDAQKPNNGARRSSRLNRKGQQPGVDKSLKQLLKKSKGVLDPLEESLKRNQRREEPKKARTLSYSTSELLKHREQFKNLSKGFKLPETIATPASLLNPVDYDETTCSNKELKGKLMQRKKYMNLLNILDYDQGDQLCTLKELKKKSRKRTNYLKKLKISTDEGIKFTLDMLREKLDMKMSASEPVSKKEKSKHLIRSTTPLKKDVVSSPDMSNGAATSFSVSKPKPLEHIIKKASKRENELTTLVAKVLKPSLDIPQETVTSNSVFDPNSTEKTRKKEKRKRGRKRTIFVEKCSNSTLDIPQQSAAPNSISDRKSVKSTKKRGRRKRRSVPTTKDLNTTSDTPKETAAANLISDSKSLDHAVKKKKRRKRRKKLTNPIAKESNSTSDMPQESAAHNSISDPKSEESTKKENKSTHRSSLTSAVAIDMNPTSDMPQEKAAHNLISNPKWTEQINKKENSKCQKTLTTPESKDFNTVADVLQKKAVINDSKVEEQTEKKESSQRKKKLNIPLVKDVNFSSDMPQELCAASLISDPKSIKLVKKKAESKIKNASSTEKTKLIKKLSNPVTKGDSTLEVPIEKSTSVPVSDSKILKTSTKKEDNLVAEKTPKKKPTKRKRKKTIFLLPRQWCLTKRIAIRRRRVKRKTTRVTKKAKRAVKKKSKTLKKKTKAAAAKEKVKTQKKKAKAAAVKEKVKTPKKKTLAKKVKPKQGSVKKKARKVYVKKKKSVNQQSIGIDNELSLSKLKGLDSPRPAKAHIINS